MASIVVSGDTSGSVTLSAPAVAGTVTVTLPSANGTMLTTASSTGVSGSAISSGTVAEAYGGTGTNTGYYGFKNRIINGSQLISQRYGSTLKNDVNGYVTDRWAVYNGISTVSMGQTTTAPTGYTNSLYVTTTTAGAMSAGNTYNIAQCIEANNVTDFGYGTANALTFTLSFWVRSSLTGTFAISINNGATNISPAPTRSYVTTYTISTANTWEQKTITVAGDQSGTWNTSGNGIGITVCFDLGSGTTYATATTNTWQTGNYLRSSSSTNFNLTTGATFYITGVQLEKGSTATSFDYRPYGTELQLCQRYYAKMGQGSASFAAFGSGMYNGATSANLFIKYPNTMRASPTLSYGGNIQVTTGTTGNNITAINATYMGLDSCLWQPSGVSGTTGYGAVLMGNSDNTCYVAFSAEL